MERKENSERQSTGRPLLGIALILVLLATIFYMVFRGETDGGDGKQAELTVAEEKADTLTDAETGLVLDAGWELVKVNCTACHSAALVTQNRATREGWEGMIRWMQRTQKLWDLGENEQAILDYLAKNYAPERKGRRENLKDIEWYELEGPPVTGNQ